VLQRFLYFLDFFFGFAVAFVFVFGLGLDFSFAFVFFLDFGPAALRAFSRRGAAPFLTGLAFSSAARGAGFFDRSAGVMRRALFQSRSRS
jgi:hypothetical protein